jgi:glycosyltransferase involved in cell wall biosynthesis
MACGPPAVATRCGGPEGVLEEGRTGVLVDVGRGNAGPFAEAVLGLLAAPEQLAAMRQACVEYARAHFARPLIEDRLLGAFRAAYPEHF